MKYIYTGREGEKEMNICIGVEGERRGSPNASQCHLTQLCDYWPSSWWPWPLYRSNYRGQAILVNPCSSVIRG